MQDEPLFSAEGFPDGESDGETPNTSKRLSAEEFKRYADMFFRRKILNFGFGSVFLILILALILVNADFYAQEQGYNSDLIKELLSLLTYIATAALGYIFGTNSK